MNDKIHNIIGVCIILISCTLIATPYLYNIYKIHKELEEEIVIQKTNILKSCNKHLERAHIQLFDSREETEECTRKLQKCNISKILETKNNK